jgi:hypothetical protein
LRIAVWQNLPEGGRRIIHEINFIHDITKDLLHRAQPFIRSRDAYLRIIIESRRAMPITCLNSMFEPQKCSG